MRSPITGKIPKRSESAFPNRGYLTVICLIHLLDPDVDRSLGLRELQTHIFGRAASALVQRP